jgi:periplasmic protein TonB
MRQIFLSLLLIVSFSSLFSQDREIFKVDEKMPQFPGCDIGDNQENQTCTQQKLDQYIIDNLIYPDLALNNGIEGIVIVRFVISKDSIIKDVEILRDLGYGCGDEATKLILEMNNFKEKWTPGKRKGVDIDVKYTYPVRFKRSLKKKKKK